MSMRLIVDKLEIWGISVNKHFKRVLVRVSVSAALLLSTLGFSPASAVTFGNPVDNPLEIAPYVVSIWVSEKGDVRQAEFICTGTLIAPTIILTAAHCTDFGNVSYFVKIKAVALQEDIQFYAATPWTGTRYDPGTRVKPPEGDIGLLKINAKIMDIPVPSLATPAIAKLITTKTRLTLMGWGLDQNRKLADTLHYSNLVLQDVASKKYWGKYFNKNTMISAGKYISAEKKWSGSCNGDSGGPLIAKVNGINYVVGVTSWGAQECRVEAPSVFSRVSYFEKDIRSGIKAVELLANKVNRLAPVEVVSPIMQGAGTPGSALTCNSGIWENTVSVEVSWVSPARLVGNTNPITKIIAADAGLEFKCRVVARSKSGDTEATVTRTLTKTLPKKLAVASPPVIGGLDSSAYVTAGSVARCEAWNWAEPIDTETIQWYTTSAGNVSTPVNGKLIGTGVELQMTQEILKTERGRYLVCQVTGTRDGFPSYLVASKFISAPVALSISEVAIRASSLKSGSTASCAYTTSATATTATYEWGFSGAGNAFTSFPGQTADFIQINQQIIKSASGQKLACKVTITNQGETTSRVGTSSEIFESALEVPKATVSVSTNVYVGSSASCSIPSNSKYLSTVYEWGITTANQSGIFVNGVIGRGANYTFDKESLLAAAGNYLTCVATVENEVGKAQGIASSSISANSAPALPTLGAISISSQTKSNSLVTVAISIPSIYGFDQSTMEVRLRLSGTTCDGSQVYSFPSVLTCAGLQGSRSYSGYLEIKYLANSAIPSRQSSTLTFMTIDTTLTPSISLSNPIQSVTVNTPITAVTSTNSGGAINSGGYAISPSLPSGLTFNTSTGSISGTPTQVQSQRSYTITATGIGGSTTATFTLTVIAAAIAPSISLSNPVQSVTTNNSISTVTVTNTGGPVSTDGYSISPLLPSGLTFNTNTGSISGTPNQVQTQRSYTITGTGSGGTSSAIFMLTVLAAEIAPSITLSNSVQSVIANTAITTVYATNSGGAINSGGYAISPSLSAGLTFSTSTGSISGTPTQPQSQRSYTITATGMAGTSTATFILTVIAATPAPSITLSNSIQTVTVNTPISTASVSNSGGAINSYGFAISPSLPSGLTFNTSTGSISGTPTQTQNQRIYTITAIGTGGSAIAIFTLTVTAALVDIASPVIATTGATFSVSEITAGSGVTATFRASDDVGVTSITLAIANSSNTIIGQISASLISGSEIDGSYRATIAVPAGTAVGTYKLIAKGSDASGKNSVGNSGISQYVLLGTIAVVLPKDEQSPSINAANLQVSPTLMNENGSVTIVIPAEDNIGVTGIQVTISRSSDYPTSPAQNTSTTFNLTRVSGTSLSGNWSGSQSMNIRWGQSDGYLGEGYYNLLIKAFDAAGNISEISSSNAFVLGSQGSGPYISNTSTLAVSTPLVRGGTFKIQTRLSAYGHTISRAFVQSDGYNMNFNVPLTRISGNSTDGIYEATITLSSNQTAGTFTYWIEAGTDNGRAGLRVDVPMVIVAATPTIYELTGWDVTGGGSLPRGRSTTFEIKTMDRSNTFVLSVVAKSLTGLPDKQVNRFWKSRGEAAGTIYPDSWQAYFEIFDTDIPGSAYQLYWTIKQSNGAINVYIGGNLSVSS